MLVPTLIAALIVLAPVAYVALRKLSVVEQEITFEIPQAGVAGITVVIHDDMVRRLRIVYADGHVCEVCPDSAARQDPAPSTPHPGAKRDVRSAPC